MSLFRLLLLSAAIYLVWRMLNPLRRREPRPGAGSAPPGYERMRRCSQCGTHLPVTALSPGGRCGRCSG
jgi:hypothetical protein